MSILPKILVIILLILVPNLLTLSNDKIVKADEESFLSVSNIVSEQKLVIDDYISITNYFIETEKTTEKYVIPVIIDKNEVTMIIKKWSDYYEVDYNLMLAVAKCESGLNSLAVGDNNNAKGIWQIWTKYHKIGDQCAFDAECSTKWAINKIADGYGNLWTCYRNIVK